jgi:3-oxoacyl-[acyl-carrier-protein] synthase III
VQAKLGMDGRGFAFDLQAVCAGFVYALNVADNFIRAGQVKTALVIGAETFTRILDWEDRTTCVLFGDGAGAVVLEAAGNAMVKLPAVEVLSEPKSSTATAGLVRVVPALDRAEGVVL